MIFIVLILILFTPGLVVYSYLGGLQFSVLFWLVAAIYLLFQITRNWSLVLPRDLLRQLLLFQGGALGVGLPIILTRPTSTNFSELFFAFSLVMFLLSMIADLIYLAVISDDRFVHTPIAITLTTVIVIYYIYALMGLIHLILTR